MNSFRVVFTGQIAQLNCVTAAQGQHHPIAVEIIELLDVEVLFNDDYPRAEVAGADGGGKPRGLWSRTTTSAS